MRTTHHQMWIECSDGARFSIAAGDGIYSTPRDNDGPYTHVEVGFPSVIPPKSWHEYAENPNDLTETVYPYLPVSLIADFLTEHNK